MRKILTLLLLSVVSLYICQAQEVEIDAKTDSSQVYIGDQLTYTVNIMQPANIKLKLPAYTDTLTGKIEILYQDELDTLSQEEDYISLEKRYIITSFDSGYYQIPPYVVEYETEGGIKRYYSDYVPLQVKRVNIAPADSTDIIFDIIGPERVGYSAGEIIPWILIILVVAIAIWLIYRYLPARKRKDEQEGPRMPDEPIHIIALRNLDKLEKKKLWEAGKIKEYYSELTEILRFYIEIRFGLRALEMTSEEIMTALPYENPGENSLNILRKILQHADLSKFAKYKHDADINISAMTGAREFIKTTYLKEEEGKDENGSDDKVGIGEGKEAGNE